jgi:hypothetical protein
VSRVEFRNRSSRSVVHLPTRRAGELQLHDRVTTRGKGEKLTAVTIFGAFFTFDDPLICALSDVPDNGGYFMLEDGRAEVTQLIARFTSEVERTTWLESLFDIRSG